MVKSVHIFRQGDGVLEGEIPRFLYSFARDNGCESGELLNAETLKEFFYRAIRRGLVACSVSNYLPLLLGMEKGGTKYHD